VKKVLRMKQICTNEKLEDAINEFFKNNPHVLADRIEQEYEEVLEDHVFEGMTIDEEVEAETEAMKTTGYLKIQHLLREVENQLIDTLIEEAKKQPELTSKIDINELEVGRRFPSTRKRLLEIALKI